MNIVPFIFSWAVLASLVGGLAIYRKVIARKEDDYIHLDEKIENQQNVLAHRLELVDKWGKTLTIVAAVYSLVVIAVLLYNGWTDAGRIS